MCNWIPEDGSQSEEPRGVSFDKCLDVERRHTLLYPFSATFPKSLSIVQDLLGFEVTWS